MATGLPLKELSLVGLEVQFIVFFGDFWYRVVVFWGGDHWCVSTTDFCFEFFDFLGGCSSGSWLKGGMPSGSKASKMMFSGMRSAAVRSNAVL
jgi:hypothetical protein